MDRGNTILLISCSTTGAGDCLLVVDVKSPRHNRNTEIDGSLRAEMLKSVGNSM